MLWVLSREERNLAALSVYGSHKEGEDGMCLSMEKGKDEKILVFDVSLSLVMPTSELLN